MHRYVLSVPCIYSWHVHKRVLFAVAVVLKPVSVGWTRCLAFSAVVPAEQAQTYLLLEHYSACDADTAQRWAADCVEHLCCLVVKLVVNRCSSDSWKGKTVLDEMQVVIPAMHVLDVQNHVPRLVQQMSRVYSHFHFCFDFHQVETYFYPVGYSSLRWVVMRNHVGLPPGWKHSLRYLCV